MKRVALIIEKKMSEQKRIAGALSDLYRIKASRNGIGAKSMLRAEHVDLAIVNMESAGEDPFKLFSWMVKNHPFTPVIVTSDEEKVSFVVRMVKEGASDFLVKPFSEKRVRQAVVNTMEERRLKHEIDYLRHEQDVVYSFNGVVAESPSMVKVIRELEKFSITDSTILMTGETGTGKSFLSGTIHFNSHRRKKPFVKINCANLPETLLESELFGHEKGAFTSADKLRIGRFEQAEGGTIFLDEIGDISLSLQAKLLRVLEDKSFERIGGNKTICSDVRVIAATNRNLRRLISERKFRRDLYYRINVLSVQLPPLRRRKACIEPLANILRTKLTRSLKKQNDGFSPQVLEWFKSYHWPGNIRQLANIIERGIILEESPVIQPENVVIQESCDSIIPDREPDDSFLTSTVQPLNPGTETEREMIVKALEESLWIQKDAAGLLRISPRTLNYKIKKFGITHPRWRKNK